MIKNWLYTLKRYLQPSAVVLMYHRIAAPESDVWDIAVSAPNFEEHLQLLKRKGNVIPLKEMVAGLTSGALKRNSIAITFDDGFVDNFSVARPLLEQYKLPATFFITTGNLGQEKEFWWDELEHLILFAEQLPPSFNATVGGELVALELGTEASLNDALRMQHRQWRAFVTEPPGARAALFLQLWQLLRPMPHAEQQQALNNIRQWAGVPPTVRHEYKSMTAAQLQQLASNSLFDIGIHTVTHPALAYHSAPYQHKELVENKLHLEKLIERETKILAYPYGNYNELTLQLVKELNLMAALTTEEQRVTPQSNLYRVGRFQVKNWSGAVLADYLNTWKSPKQLVP